MVCVVNGIQGSGKVKQSRCLYPVMIEYHCAFWKGQFQLSEISYMQTDNDWICLNYLSEFRWLAPQCLKNLGREARIGHWLVVFFILSSLRVGFFNRWKASADLKCEGKKPSESDKLISWLLMLSVTCSMNAKTLSSKVKLKNTHTFNSAFFILWFVQTLFGSFSRNSVVTQPVIVNHKRLPHQGKRVLFFHKSQITWALLSPFLKVSHYTCWEYLAICRSTFIQDGQAVCWWYHLEPWILQYYTVQGRHATASFNHKMPDF